MDTQFNFEIILRAPLGEMYEDINYLSFIRTPLLKNCSYALMKINLTPILIQQMMNDINNNIFEDYQLEIYAIDEGITNKKTSIIFSKLFKILYVKPLESLKFDKQFYPCTIVLSNSIFHYMSTANTYNKILNNVTGYDAIQEYESFLNNTYGDIFKSRHIGTKTNINEYIYEQILVKAKDDLNVPIYLINTFKPFSSFNFYFLDDFNIDSDSDNEITCHYINFPNKDNFERIDISTYGDIVNSTTKFETYPISDQFLNLDKINHTYTILDKDIKYNTIKSTSSQIPKHSTSSSLNEIELIDDRTIKVGEFVSPSQKKSLNTSSQHANIYAPDNSDAAIKRFEQLKEFFMTKIDCIQVYETVSCLPDWCQFGKCYNLDYTDPTSFIYTPINIVNIFTRNNIREEYCSHLVRYSMLKFIDEDVDSSFWNNRS